MPVTKKTPIKTTKKRGNGKIDLGEQYIFDTILAQAFRSGIAPQKALEAAKWFRDKAKKLGKNVTPEGLMSEADRLRARQTIGKMYHFVYDPKHKDTLPYYDTFPLVFPIGPAPGGFLGINLHYLEPPMRAKLMDALFGILNNKKFNQTTKLQVSYEVLNASAKLKYFRPCVKHYLRSHVQSRFLQIEATEWNIALFLPTERFEKRAASYVWRQSRKLV